MAIKAKNITIGIKTLEEGAHEIAEAYESYQARSLTPGYTLKILMHSE